MPRTLWIDHLVLLVKDLRRTDAFYSPLLGPPIERSATQLAYQIGDAKLFFGVPANENGPAFDKENLGLNHLALGVASLAELQGWEKALNSAHINHSGIQIDPAGDTEFIWFNDPDGIRIEFYLRRSGARAKATKKSAKPVPKKSAKRKKKV